MATIQWGLSSLVPEDAPAAWGARAILQNGFVDLIPDRQGMGFSDDLAKHSLAVWLGTQGLAWLGRIAKQMRGDESKLYEHDDEGFHIRANTNASHGYVYIAAWVDGLTVPEEF